MKLSAIDAVRVFSDEFQTTKDFYVEKLDLPIGYESQGVCVFDLPGTKLILEEVDLSDPDTVGFVGRFTGVSFSVLNIKDTYKALKSKGVPFSGKPVFEEWGGALAHFSDPVNNTYTLIQYPEPKE